MPIVSDKTSTLAPAESPAPAQTDDLPRRVGIREVADHAGVAIASVSRVLSNHPDVSGKMRDRVLAAISELGYQPDFLAKSLRTGSTMMVGIVVTDICNPMMAQIVHAAEVRLRQGGYTSLVVSSLNDPELEVEHIEMLRQRRVDGIMISVSNEESAESARRLGMFSAPVVLLDRDVPGMEKGWAVKFDHVSGLLHGVDYLLGLGHRNIALINGNPRIRPARERVIALSRACAKRPDVNVEVRAGEFATEHGYHTTIELMSGLNPPTALISGNNQILVGVMEALRKLRISVPDDVSLITCDDVPMAAFLKPRLATIRRAVEEMGRLSADFMLRAMAKQSPQTITLSTVFDPAESCGVPRGGNR